MLQTIERDPFFLFHMLIFEVSLDIEFCQGPSLIQSSAPAGAPKEEQIISSLPSNEIFNLGMRSDHARRDDLVRSYLPSESKALRQGKISAHGISRDILIKSASLEKADILEREKGKVLQMKTRLDSVVPYPIL
jgi:hypothetical protein